MAAGATSLVKLSMERTDRLQGDGEASDHEGKFGRIDVLFPPKRV